MRLISFVRRRLELNADLTLILLDTLSIVVMSVIMGLGAWLTFRLFRGGVFARPARIILLAAACYFTLRAIDLYSDWTSLFTTQFYILFNNIASFVFSLLFFLAIFELYRVLKRLTLP